MKTITTVPGDFKNPSLRRWRVKEVKWPDGLCSRHVYGHDVANDTGRVSSAIKEFDFNTMSAITESGRKYMLLGFPGSAANGEYAWEQWRITNEISIDADVTSEYFNDANHSQMVAEVEDQSSKIGEKQMTYRFSKRLAFLQLTAAFAMSFALYVATEPKIWGWLLFLPLFAFVVFKAVRTYRYSLTINDDSIDLIDFESSKYPISDIAAINVWPAKGDRIAVITFSDRRKFSFPGYLEGFDDLVRLLRQRTAPNFES